MPLLTDAHHIIDRKNLELLLDKILADLEQCCDVMRRTSHPVTGTQLFNEAFAACAAVGIPSLKVARRLWGDGWAPEAHVQLRVAVDVIFSLAHLHSVEAQDRHKAAQKFFAMKWLRAPTPVELIEEEPERFAEEQVEQFRTAKILYGDPKALNPRNHWNGIDRGEFIQE